MRSCGGRARACSISVLASLLILVPCRSVAARVSLALGQTYRSIWCSAQWRVGRIGASVIRRIATEAAGYGEDAQPALRASLRVAALASIKLDRSGGGDSPFMSAVPPILTVDSPCREVPRAAFTHRGKQPIYSITSSASANSDGGTVRPIIFAVCRLTTNSNFVARKTGRSDGFSPLRTRAVYMPAKRARSIKFVP